MDRQRAEGRRCRLVTRRDERAVKKRQETEELRSLRRKSRGEKTWAGDKESGRRAKKGIQLQER